MTPSDFAPFERIGNGQAPSVAVDLDRISAMLREAASECDMAESGDHGRALRLARQAVARLDAILSAREASNV